MNHTIEIIVTAHDEDKLAESELVANHGITLTIIPPMDAGYLRWDELVDELVRVTAVALNEKLKDALWGEELSEA